MRGSPELLALGDVGSNCSKALPPSLLPSIRSVTTCKLTSTSRASQPGIPEQLKSIGYSCLAFYQTIAE